MANFKCGQELMAPFTDQELELIIHQLQTNKAPGPDNMHNKLISHFGTIAKS